MSLVLATSGPPTSGVLVDRVVAVVDKQVITESELLLEARVALVQQVGEVPASSDLEQAFLETFLDYLINQTLVALQARRSGGIEVSEEDIERELKRFGLRFRSVDAFRAFLRRFDISDETLRNIITRNLRNERYMESRMRLRLLEGDAQAGTSSARYREALARWITELRAGAELRLLGPTGELEIVPAAATE